ENLGSSINSEYNEIAPWLDPDGERLYFSSKGYPGMGGHDIFQSILGQDGKWSKPINMGHPINDAEDDYHFRVSSSADTAWFSSLRDGRSEKRNVYMIPNIPDETELLALEELLDEAYKYKVEFGTVTHETATLNEEEELALEKANEVITITVYHYIGRGGEYIVLELPLVAVTGHLLHGDSLIDPTGCQPPDC
ncbi:MAG: PD40 domain-containing protein, partial [Bacteroidetes bacterium]|nr:PD40 domain-containing protein [Bacteroidota bacterium]